MSNSLLVIDVVGLSQSLLGENTPHINELIKQGCGTTITPVIPAVTCSSQTTYLTGLKPSQHGIVGNGWYFKDVSEVRFWHQSNHLIEGEMVWDKMKEMEPAATCANLFWWYNMYNTSDYSVTPRPLYCADGRKIPDVYAHPAELRFELSEKLGQFPLFNFWGPTSNLVSSKWIVDATLTVMAEKDPTLTLCYLPHLDYVLQKKGPNDESVARELNDIDVLCGQLINHAKKTNRKVVLLSEYGIEPVNKPVHLNRVLRESGYLQVKDELGLELLDCGASAAFAVADHQISHVYIRQDRRNEGLFEQRLDEIKNLLLKQDGVEQVLVSEEEKALFGLNHDRAGDIIVLAEQGAWFTYYYWLDDEKAPDFARCIDIHRKPGYDPVELFFNPNLFSPKLSAIWRVAKKKLGFRMLMDLIPLDATLVKGSHGRVPSNPEYGALIACSEHCDELDSEIEATAVKQLLLDLMFKN